jgi:hypothetical protein
MGLDKLDVAFLEPVVLTIRGEVLVPPRECICEYVPLPTNMSNLEVKPGKGKGLFNLLFRELPDYYKVL